MRARVRVRVRARGRAVAVAACSALLLSGCTGDGGDAAPGPGGGDPSASASGSPAVPASERLLAEDAGLEPLAAAEAALPLLGSSTSPVRVEVLEVRAGAETTLLRWRLSSATAEVVETYTSALSRPIGFDTRQVALLARDARLQPFTFVPDGEDDDLDCVCSTLPGEVGPEGRTLFALYPALDPGTTEVDVVLPGVVELTGVPVSR